MGETKKRSFMKTMSFRVLATIVTILIVWVFTENAILSLGIGSIEFVSKLFLYYFHERAWERVEWGKGDER